MPMTTATQPHPATTAPASPRTSARSLTDDAYVFIKWKILSLEFPPGTWLNEHSLVELTGFGRAPIHHALHRLQSNGLVEIIPRKGVQVKLWSARDIDHLIEARLPLETAVARLAAQRAEPAEIEALQRQLVQGQQMLDAADREGLVRLDHAFHQAIARSTRNPMLAEMVEILHQRSMLMWYLPLADHDQYRRMLARHQRILNAIASGDPDAAAQAMAQHFSDLSQPSSSKPSPP